MIPLYIATVIKSVANNFTNHCAGGRFGKAPAHAYRRRKSDSGNRLRNNILYILSEEVEREERERKRSASGPRVPYNLRVQWGVLNAIAMPAFTKKPHAIRQFLSFLRKNKARRNAYHRHVSRPLRFLQPDDADRAKLLRKTHVSRYIYKVTNVIKINVALRNYARDIRTNVRVYIACMRKHTSVAHVAPKRWNRSFVGETVNYGARTFAMPLTETATSLVIVVRLTSRLDVSQNCAEKPVIREIDLGRETKDALRCEDGVKSRDLTKRQSCRFNRDSWSGCVISRKRLGSNSKLDEKLCCVTTEFDALRSDEKVDIGQKPKN